MGNVPPNKDGQSNNSSRDSPRHSRGNPPGSRNYHQPNHGQHGQQQPPSSMPPHQQHQGQYGGGAPGMYPPGPHSSHQQYDPSRMSSDTNMNDMNMNNHGGGGGGPNSAQPIDLLSVEDDSVPTVFRWEHGGRQVYITGTFNGWSRQIPMHRSGNDFTYIHNLKRGKHAFKFIVDDEWRFAPDQPTVADIEGRINNFIDVSDFRAYTGDKNFEERAEGAAIPGKAKKSATPQPNESGHVGAPAAPGDEKEVVPEEDGFSNNMPDLDEYTKEPPPLPPHLRHIILNKPPQLSDTAALPVPQHVALNHLYCTAIKDNMMVLGVTQRYKTKFVTTVYYSPCAS